MFDILVGWTKVFCCLLFAGCFFVFDLSWIFSMSGFVWVDYRVGEAVEEGGHGFGFVCRSPLP